MVLISTTLASEPGKFLDQTVNVDGREIALASGALIQPTSAVRVVPGGARWVFASRFYHFEEQTVVESVPRSESEYDSCEHIDYRGHCQSGYRYVTRYRLETVTKTQIVDDARCSTHSSALLAAPTCRA